MGKRSRSSSVSSTCSDDSISSLSSFSHSSTSSEYSRKKKSKKEKEKNKKSKKEKSKKKKEKKKKEKRSKEEKKRKEKENKKKAKEKAAEEARQKYYVKRPKIEEIGASVGEFLKSKGLSLPCNSVHLTTNMPVPNAALVATGTSTALPLRTSTTIPSVANTGGKMAAVKSETGMLPPASTTNVLTSNSSSKAGIASTSASKSPPRPISIMSFGKKPKVVEKDSKKEDKEKNDKNKPLEEDSNLNNIDVEDTYGFLSNSLGATHGSEDSGAQVKFLQAHKLQEEAEDEILFSIKTASQAQLQRNTKVRETSFRVPSSVPKLIAAPSISDTDITTAVLAPKVSLNAGVLDTPVTSIHQSLSNYDRTGLLSAVLGDGVPGVVPAIPPPPYYSHQQELPHEAARSSLFSDANDDLCVINENNNNADGKEISHHSSSRALLTSSVPCLDGPVIVNTDNSKITEINKVEKEGIELATVGVDNDSVDTDSATEDDIDGDELLIGLLHKVEQEKVAQASYDSEKVRVELLEAEKRVVAGVSNKGALIVSKSQWNKEGLDQNNRNIGANWSAVTVFADDEADDADDCVAAKKIVSLSKSDNDKIKKMPRVDHNTIDYPPFQKNFYIPPSETAKLSIEEIRQLTKELDGAKVEGMNPPRPMRSWVGCGLHGNTLEYLREKKGYAAPFAIQCLAM
eukprot:Tbor_TRINITY_DN2254_c0_g2::TRINITY_DN2254_c0_g2_i1::g.2747::m.2747